MPRLFAIFLILTFFAPSLSLAAEPPQPQTDQTSAPVFLFTYDDDSILALTPLNKDYFLWVYFNPNYTYDANGNLTSRSDNFTHTWDYNNRLTKVTITGAQTKTLTYGYDSSGTRVWDSSKTVGVANVATTTYPTPYYNTDGTTQKEHIFLNGASVAEIEKVGSSTKLYFNAQDHLDSTRIVTDASGTIAESTDYEAFGKLKSDVGSHKEQRKFTGHEYDLQNPTNYTYALARYLETNWGRFMSEDPGFLAIGDQQETRAKAGKKLDQILANPQSQNSYSYVENNPIKFVDPTGQSAISFLGEFLGKATPYVNVASFAYDLFKPTQLTNDYGYSTQQNGQQGNVSSNNSAPTAIVVGSTAANSGLKIGEKTAFGEVIENTAGKLTSFTSNFTQKPFHGLERFLERGLTVDQFYDTLRDPLVTFKQAGGNTLRLSEEAVVVLDKAGGLVTTYSKTFFKAPILNILKLLE